MIVAVHKPSGSVESRSSLTSVRRHDVLEIWDDTRIQSGQDWRAQIDNAMENASAAILLVGAGFLASEFIRSCELPALLKAARTRGVRIFPLIIGYCAYNRSDLDPFQSFNKLDQPLEALATAAQNNILNNLAMEVDAAVRHATISIAVGMPDLPASVRAIRKHLQDTLTAFVAQCRRRDDLFEEITTRLKFHGNLEYERFFFRHFDEMTPEERFEFDQIRAITEGPMRAGNSAILEILNANPELLDEIPDLTPLRQHLVFWLNKYDKVFVNTNKMCVLYTGVEDGVPFPGGLDSKIAKWSARKS